MDGENSKVEIAKQRICKLEDNLEKNIHHKKLREKWCKRGI